MNRVFTLQLLSFAVLAGVKMVKIERAHLREMLELRAEEVIRAKAEPFTRREVIAKEIEHKLCRYTFAGHVTTSRGCAG
jgi:hypothetical protein